MNRCRIIPLVLWLSTILLMAAGMLVPTSVAAHPGHGERAKAPHAASVQVTADPASRDHHDPAASRQENTAAVPGNDETITEEPAGAEGSCSGAVCCGTGHACCAAYPVAAVDTPAPAITGCIPATIAGVPPGLGATTIPEPPRPAG